MSIKNFWKKEHNEHTHKHKKHIVRNIFFLFLTLGFFATGVLLIWSSTIELPNIETLENWTMSESTKIFDRTGKVLLYDVHSNIKRTVVSLDQISTYATRASISIEDSRFYEHNGVDLKAIVRMIWVNLTSHSFSQGGSTITQQVAKNAFLSPEKTVTRKLKEWIIAIKMERVLTKDKILELYFNEVPYGGSIYGIEEASRAFFNIHAKDLDLAQSAYLAAIPQAPTYYSPYGNNKKNLDTRKDLVLSKMLETKVITQEEYDKAKKEEVKFIQQNPSESITAPHFVLMVKQYLEDKYGADMIEKGGLNIITTLDAGMQTKTEDAVKQYGEANVTEFNAHNAAAVGIDPKTGQVLVMVGSRDYFNKEIDGNFNVALSPNRQPGSSFKPFIYVTAFEKGYTPNTALFDVATEFNSSCTPNGVPASSDTKPEECYMPTNYDMKYRGPMALRDALAQSINIPAVKLSYLVGVQNAINTAQKMGINTLGDANQYGLTLVLGSGQVSLYEMTGAYGVFANNGNRNPNTFIIKITNGKGDILEEYQSNPEVQVIQKNAALEINKILSDNNARIPAYGAGSALEFPGRQVAVKTGTTNDSRDTWIIGYTPSFVLGTWAGNNDNSPMVKKVAGMIVAPMWHAIMASILPSLPTETFEVPAPIRTDIKPILRGDWRNGGAHTILNQVDKNDPLGPAPANPASDSQYWLWETGIRRWADENDVGNYGNYTAPVQAYTAPTQTTVAENPVPIVSIQSPTPNSVFKLNQKVMVSVSASSKFPLTKADLYVNGKIISTSPLEPFRFYFYPSSISELQENNTIRVIVTDFMNGTAAATTHFSVSE